MNNMEDVKYLDIKDTSKLFGISERTIYRYVRAGKIRCVQAGARLAIEVSSVREWFSDEPQNVLRKHRGELADTP